MPIEFSVEDRIATVVIAREDSLNAIDSAMRRDMREVWRRIAEDSGIDVAIITGAGDRAFSAGADLREATGPAKSFAATAFGESVSESLTYGSEMDKPLICAFNGLAYGGGLEIGLACDIRVASTTARFALSEARVGTLPGSGGTQRLPRLVGRSDAMLMLLTGDSIDATEALRIGLVSRLFPPAEVRAGARAIAMRIAANAPLSVRGIKHLVRTGEDLPLERALEAERSAWGHLRDTEDRREGRAAFAEKRMPTYKGC